MIYQKLRKPGQCIHTVKLFVPGDTNDPWGRFSVEDQGKFIDATLKGNWSTHWGEKEIFDPDIGDWVCPITFRFEDPDAALMFSMKYSHMMQPPRAF